MANKIEYWWDSADPNYAGWYARILTPENECIDDSMKAWFLVDVDNFSAEERLELHRALQEAYALHDVVWLDDQ